MWKRLQSLRGTHSVLNFLGSFLFVLILSANLHAHPAEEAVDVDRIYDLLAKGQLALARESATSQVDRENPEHIDPDLLGALGLAELGTGQMDQASMTSFMRSP